MNAAASMAKTLALSSAESLINKALHFDPVTLQGLQSLEGKVISLCGRSPAFQLHLLPTEEGISLFSIYDEGEADASLHGTTFDLVQLLRKKDQSLADSPIEIQGDQTLAEECLNLARELEVDWEELLSGFIGDIAAHEISRQGRRFGRWAKKVHQSMLRNTREYLHYESRVVVNEEEIQQFGAEVAQLNEAVNNLEARIQTLKARLAS
jgi:ubiquinone biosynthesis protein UbiJ